MKKNVKIKECKILNSWRHWKNTQVFLFILVPNMFSFVVLYQKDLRIMLGKLILKIHTFDKEKVCFKSTGKSSKKKLFLTGLRKLRSLRSQKGAKGALVKSEYSWLLNFHPKIFRYFWLLNFRILLLKGAKDYFLEMSQLVQ